MPMPTVHDEASEQRRTQVYGTAPDLTVAVSSTSNIYHAPHSSLMIDDVNKFFFVFFLFFCFLFFCLFVFF